MHSTPGIGTTYPPSYNPTAMPFLNWTRKLISRRRRRRERFARRELVEPVRLSLRKLEERRVLDVSAAFMSATGELELEVTNTADIATLSNSNGDVEIADANDSPVGIDVDGSGPGQIRMSDVRSIVVRGDAASSQEFVLDTPLAPRDGIRVENTIESAVINNPITRVANNGIALNSLAVTLGANLEATGLDISLGGNVTLADDVALTGENVQFAGTINDDGDDSTGSSLTVNASGVTSFDGEVGGQQAIDGLRTDAPGRSELAADVTASGNTITFNDPVLLKNDVSITDTGATGIKFNSTVDSEVGAHHSLTASATNGRVAFSGDIGDGAAGDQSLGTLTIAEAADGVVFGEKAGVAQIRTQGEINIGSVAGGIGGIGVQFNGGGAGLLTITTNGGNVRWNGPSVLVTNVDVFTGGGNLTLTADAPLNSQPNAVRKLTIDAGAGAVVFNEDIGRKVPLNGLDIRRADAGVSFGAAGAETPGTGGAGPVEVVNSVGPITIGSGANVIGGSGVVFDAGDGNMLSVATTGDNVFVNGGVELRSGLSIDTGSNAGDITFTPNAAIDSETGEANDAAFAAGRGSVSLSADVGRNVPLGKLSVISAAGGVSVGGAAPVELVRAHGGIDVGVGSNEITGTGILLDGGANELRLETDGTDLRLNGKTTLASAGVFATGSGGGNVIFTNDTPFDSAAGEFNNVAFDVGDGAVLVNEDLGRDQRLGTLTVITAGGGVVFGEAVTETPGSGGKGSVEVINTDGRIDIGVGSNVVSSVMFTGTATGGATISTTGDSVRINGPTLLGTKFTVDTNAGDFTLTNDAPLDSKAGVIADVLLDVGAGSVFINEDVGGTNAVGRFTITQADGGVTLGAASAEMPGAGGTGPVNLLHAARAIDIGVGTNVIGGSGITLNGGDATLTVRTDNADIRLNGAAKAQSNIALKTGSGGGSVLLTSATMFDSHDGPAAATVVERNDLSFDAGMGGVSINAELGAMQRLGSLTFERAASGVEIGGADVAVVGGKGPVSQVLTDGPIMIGSVEAIAGGIALNGGSAALAIETSADDIDIDGRVGAWSNVRISTGTGGGDLNLSANSTLDSQVGEANDVTVTLDAGDATFEATVGATNPLGELRFVSADDVTIQTSVAAARVAQDAGSGTTSFRDSIRTTDANRIGIEVTGTDFTFDGAVAATGDGRVVITHTSLLDINDASDMQLEGSFVENGGGTVQTSASITTTGDTIRFDSPVTVTDGVLADVTFDTTSGNAAGADVTFDSTLDGQGDGIEQVTINGGDSGNVQLAGVVGGTMRLGPLHIQNANNVTAAAITATHISQANGSGTTTLNGAVNTNDTTERGVDLNTVNVSLNDAVQTTGDGRVEVTVAGLLDIADAADMTLSGSFVQDGGGSVQTAANITTSDDDVTFTGAVVARDDLRFDTGTGLGTVRFESTLDGTTDCEEDLHFATGMGDVAFADTVGGQVGLGDVAVANAHHVSFERSARINSLVQTMGTGETRFEGPVTIKDAAGINLATDMVAINAAFDTSSNNAPVRIDVTNDIVLNAGLTTGSGTVDLLADDDVRLTSVASVTTDDAIVTITADADAVVDAGSGGAVMLEDGSVINSGSADINVSADESVQLGRLVTASTVSVTSVSGSIVDGGDSGGADIVADQAALHASTGIGTSNPIDAQVNTFAGRNELAGGVRVENSGPSTLTIGDVGMLTGVSAGNSAAPMKLDGEIEIIHVGAIDVNAPILNNAGGHTTLRAELAGDLTVNQPVQNRGGDGWIFLFSGEDLFVNDSVPEPQAEISVENEGAVRGIAQRDALIDNSETDHVIIRTHAERVATQPDETNLTELSAKFSDPTHFPPRERRGEEIADPDGFYRELSEELRTIREEVAPQATNFPDPDVDPMPEDLNPAHETDPRFATHDTPFFTIASVDQGGSDVDERGRGILEVRIGTADHLERNWHLTVDWGDGNIENYTIPGNPEASLGFFAASNGAPSNIFPDGTITPRFDSGELGDGGSRQVGIYYVHHTYLEPPNPLDPAAPTPVHAELRYDARAEGEEFLDLGLPADGSGIFNGIRFFRNGSEELVATADDVMTNPGQGSTFFIKVVESVIIPVEARQSAEVFIAQGTVSVTIATSDTSDFIVVTFEGETFEEYRVFMKVVDDVAGTEGEERYPLLSTALDDPIGVFRGRDFPNGHYRVYLEEIRTGRIRLILECHIYEGRVVPADFREGTGERQPGSDEGDGVEPGAAAEGEANAEAGEDATNPFADDAPPDNNDATPDNADNTSPPGAALLLPLVGATIPWRTRVRRALESKERPVSRAALRLRRLRGRRDT